MSLLSGRAGTEVARCSPDGVAPAAVFLPQRYGIGVAVLLRDDEVVVFVHATGSFLSGASLGVSSGSPRALRFRVSTLVVSTPAQIDVMRCV
jgi:hypothetical protein